MGSEAATGFEDMNDLTLGDFNTYVMGQLRKFSRDWLKHQRESPGAFPTAISLEEWWVDFSELMESKVLEARAESAPSSARLSGSIDRSSSLEHLRTVAHSGREL